MIIIDVSEVITAYQIVEWVTLPKGWASMSLLPVSLICFITSFKVVNRILPETKVLMISAVSLATGYDPSIFL